MATEKKAKNPRNVRTYKVVDSVYKKALARAKKDKIPLSNSIENWITRYAEAIISIDAIVSNTATPVPPKKEPKPKAKRKDTGELDAAD